MPYRTFVQTAFLSGIRHVPGFDPGCRSYKCREASWTHEACPEPDPGNTPTPIILIVLNRTASNNTPGLFPGLSIAASCRVLPSLTPLP